jgi:CNT family concentrative nucleoside transporter
MWLIFTGFLCAAYALQIPKGYNQELLVLGIIYAYFTIFMFFCYVPTTIVTKPWSYTVNAISKFICERIGLRMRTILWGAFVIVVIAATVFSFPEKEESPRLKRLIALFGLVVFIAGTYAASAVKYTYVFGSNIVKKKDIYTFPFNNVAS